MKWFVIFLQHLDLGRLEENNEEILLFSLECSFDGQGKLR